MKTDYRLHCGARPVDQYLDSLSAKADNWMRKK